MLSDVSAHSLRAGFLRRLSSSLGAFIRWAAGTAEAEPQVFATEIPKPAAPLLPSLGARVHYARSFPGGMVPGVPFHIYSLSPVPQKESWEVVVGEWSSRPGCYGAASAFFHESGRIERRAEVGAIGGIDGVPLEIAFLRPALGGLASPVVFPAEEDICKPQLWEEIRFEEFDHYAPAQGSPWNLHILYKDAKDGPQTMCLFATSDFLEGTLVKVIATGYVYAVDGRKIPVGWCAYLGGSSARMNKKLCPEIPKHPIRAL